MVSVPSLTPAAHGAHTDPGNPQSSECLQCFHSRLKCRDDLWFTGRDGSEAEDGLWFRDQGWFGVQRKGMVCGSQVNDGLWSGRAQGWSLCLVGARYQG